MDDRPCWLRLSGEPRLWYDRFQLYLAADLPRSVMAVYQQVQAASGKQAAKTLPQSWVDAASRWQWRARVALWELDECRREQQSLYQQRLQAIRNQTRLLLVLQGKLAAALQSLDTENVRWTDLCAGLRITGDQLEEQHRLSLGQLWGEELRVTEAAPSFKTEDTEEDRLFANAGDSESVLDAAQPLQQLLELSAKDWRANAWLLERLHWRTFARRSPERLSTDRVYDVVRQMMEFLIHEIPSEYHELIRKKLAELVSAFVDNSPSSEGTQVSSQANDDLKSSFYDSE
ncbi:Hypothetical protein PBC10988_27530 [Planctomycetales bacterium 10988]|nr:Hypothetical protein PBC10988_27530 [Planctomycetales bacterium 10988]